MEIGNPGLMVEENLTLEKGKTQLVEIPSAYFVVDTKIIEIGELIKQLLNQMDFLYQLTYVKLDGSARFTPTSHRITTLITEDTEFVEDVILNQ